MTLEVFPDIDLCRKFNIGSGYILVTCVTFHSVLVH